jgi:NitT/TauT family transport system ATP-binding protein
MGGGEVTGVSGRQGKVLLEVRRVSKRFAAKGGVVTALDDVSFDVAEGEIVCLLGTSGGGKSTLLSLIAGLDEASEGEITLDGEPITGPGTDRGMVFQRDCLFPWLTVTGNVRFGMRLKANAAVLDGTAVGRSEYLIEAVGLGKFKDAYPKQLSGGMRQRAAIARALLNQPRVLLMDEPFGALDAQTREGMQELLLGLCAKHGTTVVFVTHDVEEAVYLGDRVVVMKAHPGEVTADVAIDLPRPRNAEMKLSEGFSRYRREILRLLHTRRETEAVVSSG